MRVKADWAKGYYRLGHTLALLHRYEEAQKALQTGTKTDPANQDIKNRLKEVNELVKKEEAKRAKMAKSNLSPALQHKEEGNALFKEGKSFTV